MSDGKELVHKDIEALKSTDQHTAFTAIAKLKNNAQLAVPQLIQVIDETEIQALKTMAIVTLGEIGVQAKDAVQSLTKCLESEQEEIRTAAALSLLRIGEPSLKELKRHIKENEGKGAFWASWAITMINPAEANTEIVNILNDYRLQYDSDFEMLAAIEALGKLVGHQLMEE